MSESNSDTSQSTNQTDNRRVIGQGGASAEGGSSITINTLDNGAVNAAFAYGNDAGKAAFGFGGQTIDFAGETVMAALGFGGKALNAALDANSDALAFAESTNNTAQRNAYNFAGDALGGSLGLATSAMNKAFNASEYVGAMVKDAYADAKGRGALTDKILIGAVLAMAVVAFAAVKK
ncbi:hypothetical protein LJR129_002488 [Acidovorax sp. LjRoot129]|uniref:hypothetical protein n=1 Tax=Acidovorax sp. LjRoot129 TaxID=3342260 RepID=UPI003ECF3CB8